MSSEIREPAFECPREGWSTAKIVVIVLATNGALGLLAIGLLAGLLVPTLRTAQDKSKQSQCILNMRQLYVATKNYETQKGRYPGYSNYLQTTNGKGYIDPTSGKPSSVSWVVELLPYLDETDLQFKLRKPLIANPKDAKWTSRPMLPVLICPVDPPSPSSNEPLLSYVVNCGQPDADSSSRSLDSRSNGVFFDRFTHDRRRTEPKASIPSLLSCAEVFIAAHDGLRYTLLISENIDATKWTETTEAGVGMIWKPTEVDYSVSPPHGKPPIATLAINQGRGQAPAKGTIDFARPSSNHPDGVNVAFADGRVVLLSEKIDYAVYCMLMTPDGENIKKVENDKLVPLPPEPEFKPEWLQQ